MKLENITITKISIVTSLLAICSIFGQYAIQTTDSLYKTSKKNENTIQGQSQEKAKIETLFKYQVELKKSGFNYLVKSIANKSVPIDFQINKNELDSYNFSPDKIISFRNEIKQTTEGLISLAQRNNWKRVSLLSYQLDLELRKSPNLEDLVQSVNYTVEQIEILDARSSLDKIQAKQLRIYMDQYKISIKKIVTTIEKRKSQKLALKVANKKISEAIAAAKLIPQRVDLAGNSEAESNFLVELILASVGLVTALYFFSKVSKNQNILLYQKNMTNFLFEKSQMAWAIFDTKGTYCFGNSYLRKFLKQVNPDLEKTPLNWQVVAETLDLKNLYSFEEIRDGSHNIPLSITIDNSINNFNLHIEKSERHEKILVRLIPETGTNQAVNPIKKSDNNYEAISINSLIEDSIEKLSTLIHATNIIVNLEMKEEIILKTDPEVFYHSITQFIKDTLLFAYNQNECRRIDILLHQSFNKPEVRVLLHGNSITTNMLNLNISCDIEERTLESSLSELEKNLAVLTPQIEIQNNLNQDKSNIFSHITVMFG